MTVRFAAAELSEGGVKVVEINGDEVAVFQRDRKLYALANRCPHSAGPLALGPVEREGDDYEVACPWHGARFRLSNGRCTFGPSTDVRAYSVRRENGEIVVDPS